jgi:hypothetical protein
MSEQWPQSESDTSVLDPDAAGRIDANGTDPDSAVAVDESTDEAIAASDESTDQAAPATEVVGAATDTEATNDTAGADATAAQTTAGDVTASQDEAADGPATETPIATDDRAVPAAESGADEGSVFLGELARAMQTTAGRERVRTSEDTERRRQAHIDAVRARESAQAASIRDLAGEDLKTIEAWAEAETTRIQLERERRAGDLNRDLETSLSEHHAKIDREVEAVEAAIAAYQSEVVAFFEGLEHETDPVAIAQHAARRPIFPALDTPSDVAAPPPDAAQTALIGVMSSAPEAKPAEAWAAPSETTPVTVAEAAADPTPEATEPAESAEPVTAGVGAAKAEGGSILQSVPVHRPMSWLRRDTNGSDRPDHDD